MLYQLLFISCVVLMVVSHPTGSPPTGSPPTGMPSGKCGPPPPPPHHHGPPAGPPKCPSNKQRESSEEGGNGNKRGHHGPPLPPPIGPMGAVSAVYCNLTQAQQQQVTQILDSNVNSTKSVLKSSLDSFVSGLSTELQQAITTSQEHFDEMKANVTAKIQNLSSAAQNLSSSIEAVFADDTLTFPAEGQKIQSIVESADPSVVKEFIDNHIPLPGLCPPKPPQ